MTYPLLLTARSILTPPPFVIEAALPHGGFKHSGFGRFGGSWGLNEFLTTKTITFSYKA